MCIRDRLSVEVQQEVRQHFKDRVYKNYIPRNVKLSEAPSRGMSIFEYDVRCEGAKAYAGLSNEVVDVYKRQSRDLKAADIKTLPYPGFATDIQQPLTALLTHCLLYTSYETHCLNLKMRI